MEIPRIKTAFSHTRDAKLAALEIYEALGRPNDGLTIFFCSPFFDLDALAGGLRDCFRYADVIGCTTAGEITSIGYVDGAICAVWLPGGEFECVTEHVENLRLGELEEVRGLVHALLRRKRDIEDTGWNTFGICLIDGIVGFEELVVDVLRRGLGETPLVGGSAGDAMRFRETAIYHAGKFHTSALAVALIRSRRPFEVFATQHFVSSNLKMVVTEADPQHRVVMEINAEPAASEYARLIGVSRRALTDAVFAMRPLAIRVGDNYFVRSIQSVDDDDALKFYCAVDEGLVLTAAGPVDLIDSLERLFGAIRNRIGEPEVVLAFDCLFRKIEVRQRRLEAQIARLFGLNHVIGFSTYGEQFNALHLNQTFTGIAIGKGS